MRHISIPNAIVRPRTVVVHLQNARVTFAAMVCSFWLVELALVAPLLPMMQRNNIIRWRISRGFVICEYIRYPYHRDVALIPELRCFVHMMSKDKIMRAVAQNRNQNTWDLDVRYTLLWMNRKQRTAMPTQGHLNSHIDLGLKAGVES